MIRGIVFDKDGTLLSYERFWVPVATAVVQHICEAHTLPESVTDPLLEAIGTHNGVAGLLCHGTYGEITEAFNTVLRHVGRTVELTVSEVADTFAACTEYGELIPTCEDPATILNNLRARGIYLGLVTSDNAALTAVCLQALGLEGIFDCILTDDGISPAKPDPHHMNTFLQRFGLSPDEVIMVGDTPIDMVFARNSGTHAIGVAENEASAQILAPLAEQIIRDISQMDEVPIMCRDTLHNQQKEH